MNRLLKEVPSGDAPLRQAPAVVDDESLAVGLRHAGHPLKGVQGPAASSTIRVAKSNSDAGAMPVGQIQRLTARRTMPATWVPWVE